MPIAVFAALAMLLAACAGSSATPTGGSTAMASPTAADPSSEPSVAASPADSGSAVDPDAGAALDAFRAFIQTDQTFHMQADVQMTVGADALDLDVAADVAGADERSEMILRSGDASVAIEIIVLDGVAYAQVANRPWEEAPLETSSSNPLLGLDAEGLEPMGSVNVAGTRTQHFRVTDPEAIDTSLIASDSITEVEIEALVFDIYVTADGAPLAAVMEFSGSGVVDGAREPLDARIRYDFSRFGAPVVIQKPAIIAPASAAP
jgi:hypothetical protein